MKPAWPRTVGRATRGRRGGNCGMTLIEILVVLGLLAILLTISIPTFTRIFKKQPLSQAVNDIMEVCAHARARAILSGTTVEVAFDTMNRSASLGGGGGAGGESPRRMVTTAHWDESVFLEMLDVNFIEYKDTEGARVRFFPNGTCDELNVVLRSDRNELRRIQLEVTTSLASVGDMR